MLRLRKLSRMILIIQHLSMWALLEKRLRSQPHSQLSIHSQQDSIIIQSRITFTHSRMNQEMFSSGKQQLSSGMRMQKGIRELLKQAQKLESKAQSRLMESLGILNKQSSRDARSQRRRADLQPSPLPFITFL